MLEYAVILQARMGSSRTPGKVGALIAGDEMLYHQIQRLLENGIKDVIVTTSTASLDDKVIEIAKKCDVKYFRGSENDVLKRYYDTAKFFEVENIIRLCGDDPLIDPICIKELIRSHQENPVDFVTTSHINGWIYGTTAELFDFNCLEVTYNLANNQVDREHVNPYMKREANFIKRKISPKDARTLRTDIYLSVDYPEDLALVKEVIEHFHKIGSTHTFTQLDLIELYDSGKLNIQNKHLHSGFND